MTARALAVVTAVVDDDDEAVEGVADRIGGLDVGGHVFVGAFRTLERAVERVDADDRRDDVANCRRMSSMSALMVGGQRERVHDEEERRVLVGLR